MTDPAPLVLNDRYELRGLIGRGGMAEVQRGFDRVLERPVAVKVMHATLTADVDRRRFESETRLLAGLNDPHLVMVLDAGVDDTAGTPRPWLVMELVTGPTLAEQLAAGPLPAGDVATIGADLAAALGHVHAAGIVHRDVKPANVLLTETGAAKLADFGVARLMAEQSDLTNAGHVIGTAAYLAPEQARGLPVTGASDVYALGLVLLEALTGRRAYAGTPTEAAVARLHQSPVIPVSLGAGWVQLLDAMTSFDPAQRPGALEVAARLDAIRGGGTASKASGTVAPTAERPVRTTGAASVRGVRADRRLVLAGAAAIVCLLVAGVALVTSGGTDSVPPPADAVAAHKSGAQPSKADPSERPSTAAPPSSSPTVSSNPARPPQTSPHHSHKGKHKAAQAQRPAKHHKKHHKKHPKKHHKGHGNKPKPKK